MKRTDIFFLAFDHLIKKTRKIKKIDYKDFSNININKTNTIMTSKLHINLKQDLLNNEDKIEEMLQIYTDIEIENLIDEDMPQNKRESLQDNNEYLTEKVLERDDEEFHYKVVCEILEKEWEDYGDDHEKTKDIIDKFVYTLDY